MVVALAIACPTAAVSPDSGTSSAMRWRPVSVGSAVAEGSGAGGGATGGGAVLGTTAHPAASIAAPAIAMLRARNWRKTAQFTRS